MANWRNEAAQFVPELKVLTLHGPDRSERFTEIADADLVLTTYPLLVRDQGILLDVTDRHKGAGDDRRNGATWRVLKVAFRTVRRMGQIVPKRKRGIGSKYAHWDGCWNWWKPSVRGSYFARSGVKGTVE